MIDRRPKVTIAIPVYNGANYLRQAIESALAQTYDNCEIIVLNDGSTDDGQTQDIAYSFGSRIRYVYQDNTGVAGAMNEIMRVMTGDVFAWLSHDDLFFPNKIQMQVDYYNNIGMRDAIIFSDVRYVDGKGEKIQEGQLDYMRYVLQPKRALLDTAINGCTLFIPVHVLKEFGPFDLSLRFTQDYDLWNKILTKYDFYFLPSPLISYRMHPDQGTHQPSAVVEGDALWVRIANQRTECERALLAGSTLSYYEQLATFLAQTPYKHAAVHAANEARAACQATRATVLLLITGDVDSCLFAASTVLRQTHRNLELLLITNAEPDDARLSRWAAGDKRVKILSFPGAGAEEAMIRGSLYANGAYLAFIDAASMWGETKLSTQIDRMQRNGVLLTQCATMICVADAQSPVPPAPVLSASTAEDLRSARLSALMIHRNFVCAGEFEVMIRSSPEWPGAVVIPDGFPDWTEDTWIVCV